MYYSHRSFVPAKNNPLPAQPSQDGAVRASPVRLSGAVRIGLSHLFFSIETTKANKNQQLTAGLFWPRQQISTEINTIQRSQQKSAKVSKIRPSPRAQSAKVSKNHHKSSQIIRNHHRSGPQSSKIINSHQKSSLFALVCKQGAVLLRANSAYWNIKECATGGPGTSYKFLLQN